MYIAESEIKGTARRTQMVPIGIPTIWVCCDYKLCEKVCQ